KVYFHALHGISVATEPQECKSGQGGASGRAPPKHFGTGLRKRSKSASDPGAAVGSRSFAARRRFIPVTYGLWEARMHQPGACLGRHRAVTRRPCSNQRVWTGVCPSRYITNVGEL